MYINTQQILRESIFLLLLLCAISNTAIAQCDPPAPPGLTCQEATFLCSLDGYCGSTDFFNNPNVPNQFCGTIESAQWFAFTADAETVTMGVLVTNCNGTFFGSGLQAQIYQTDDCQSFTVVSNCENPSNDVDLSVVAEGLTIGETYYLLLDGYFGDVCDYELVSSDIQIPTPEIKPLSAVVCPADSGPTTTCQRVCAYSTVVYQIENSPSVQWNVIGSDNFLVQGNTLTVNWGAAGSGEIYGYLPDDNCEADGFLCVDIIPIPSATFTTDPPAINNTINICKGQTVQFFNQSTDATDFGWNFGDLSYSNEAYPSHTFNAVGTFATKLVARNACNCSDTTSLLIVVEDADIPPIECLSSVCTGETATYTTPAQCTGYNWQISSNGILVAGGGAMDDFVTVEWQNGADGEVSLELFGCAQNYCNQIATIPVPIIADNVTIRGPEKVCLGALSSYSIPNYNGVEINWAISPLGTIISGQGTSNITVEWQNNIMNPPSQWVSVDFDNCYLQCSGDGFLDVEILPDFYVSGPIRTCENTTTTFEAIEGFSTGEVAVNWQVKRSDGMVAWQSSGATTTTDILWNFGTGIFILEAIPSNPNDYCTDAYSLFVEIGDTPLTITDVGGDQMVCPNEWYTYTAFSAALGVNYVWEITNGNQTEIKTGAIINVFWSDVANYGLSVRQVSNGVLPCESEPFLVDIQPLTGFDLAGSDLACLADISSFSIATNFENATYNWSIIPEDAGAIIEGQGTDSIDVFWYNEGTASIALDICEVVETIEVMVTGYTAPDVLKPDGLCSGEMGLVEAVGTFDTYEWMTATGAIIATTPTVNLTAGDYQLQVIDENGCLQIRNFTIEAYPDPLIDITVPAYLGICPGGQDPIILAIQDTPNYTYQWFLNGTPIGTSNSELSVNEIGDYQVMVTSENGCENMSETITIESCEDLGAFCVDNECTLTLPTCNFQGTLDFFTQDGQNCKNILFNNSSSGYVPGSLIWSFGDGTTSTEENPVHEYAYPGHYTAVLLGEFPDEDNPGQFCEVGIFQDVEVVALASFTTGTTCLQQPVQFFDNTVILPNHTVDSWAWNFDEPASPNNNSDEPNPTHSFSSSGTFFVTLTIVMDNGCHSTYFQAIDVAPAPSIDFQIVGNTCAGEAVQFIADTPTGAITWDFGDAASGDANASELPTPFHIFEEAGDYDVTLTLTNVAGCSSSLTQTIVVGGNAVTGNITSNIPSPICANETIELTAPSGGVSWDWNIGNSGTITTETVTIAGSGLYEVTVTDAGGCTYVPPAFSVEILEVPASTVQVVEYDDFGQPINFFENNYELCEGEDVTLEVTAFGNYTYQWSTGDTTQILYYDISHDTLLVTGSYTYDVTITDAVSGCTSVAGPMNIEVHAFPTNVTISSDLTLPVCEFTVVTLTVDNPDPDVEYFWNTGEAGTSIEVLLAGEYFVRAVNSQGCIGESNVIELEPAPDIYKIPSGCLTRCTPDTICWPNLPNVVAFQWYFNGNPIGNPLENGDELIVTESGEYHVEMTDIGGCVSASDPLTLDLFEGFGEVDGIVYFDENENGIVDAGDTLVNGTNFILLENGVIISNTNSDENGVFNFNNVDPNNYTIELDTTSLELGQGYLIQQIDTLVEGCDKVTEVVWLLIPVCIPKTAEENYMVCPDETLSYAGSEIAPGTTQEFVFSTIEDCDSTVTVNVTAYPTDSLSMVLQTCEGTTIDYNGMSLSPDTQTDFQLMNQNGCDSIMTIIVEALQRDSSTLNLATCEGATIDFNGTPLAADTQTDFQFVNQNGCDSMVTVIVSPLANSSSMVELTACEGTTIIYQNTELNGGDQMDFTLQNAAGCDSIVTVMVTTTFNDMTQVQLEACPNETIDYQGLSILSGETGELTLTNQFGCDSIILVQVTALTPTFSDITLSNCQGAFVLYQNTELLVGTTTDFTLENWQGCDSIVTVTVNETPAVLYTLSAQKTCQNEFSGSIQIQNIDGLSAPYSFSLDGIIFQNEPIFENLGSGSYQVFLEDANGCIFENEITIENFESLEAQLVSSTIECDEISTTLSPEILSNDLSTLTYLWSDSSQNNTLTVTNTGDYWVEITDACTTKRYETSVGIGAPGKRDYINIPNAFSPNNDGMNDVFQVFPLPNSEVLSFEMQVFDRWGNHLFSTNDIDNSWNGIYRNQVVETGVYIWFLEAKVAFCERTFDVFERGDVLIVR